MIGPLWKSMGAAPLAQSDCRQFRGGDPGCLYQNSKNIFASRKLEELEAEMNPCINTLRNLQIS